MLELTDLSCGYGKRVVLADISLTLRAGELLCLLGPNGVGKTTLFKTMLGLLPAVAGQISLDGIALSHWPRRRFAQRVAYVPQAHTPPFPFEVRDVVAMGRVSHLGVFSAPGKQDREMAAAALDTLGIGALAEVAYTDISGGERQLVLIARALAQQPSVLVMDEPTANLDYGNQLRVMGHIARIAADSNTAIVLTTHHPNHALMFATRVMTLDRDQRYAVGSPAAVIDEAYLRDTYRIETEIHELAMRNGGTARLCVPAGAASTAAATDGFPESCRRLPDATPEEVTAARFCGHPRTTPAPAPQRHSWRA